MRLDYYFVKKIYLAEICILTSAFWLVVYLVICVQKSFTFMDRGFVFRLVNMYLENFNPADGKVHDVLFYKLDFYFQLIVFMLGSCC